MRIEEKTVTVQYRVFEPGEKVTPVTSAGTPLKYKKTYIVEAYFHPKEGMYFHGMVHVEGCESAIISEDLKPA